MYQKRLTKGSSRPTPGLTSSVPSNTLKRRQTTNERRAPVMAHSRMGNMQYQNKPQASATINPRRKGYARTGTKKIRRAPAPIEANLVDFDSLSDDGQKTSRNSFDRSETTSTAGIVGNMGNSKLGYDELNGAHDPSQGLLEDLEAIALSPRLNKKDESWPDFEERGRFRDIGITTKEGEDHDNEDRILAQKNCAKGIDLILAVLDGHGGERCAEILQEELCFRASNIFADSCSLESEDCSEKLIEMFEQLDSDFIGDARVSGDTSGSCASVILCRGNTAVIASIGDCRVVKVGAMGRWEELTIDHRADEERENKRILKAGGIIDAHNRVCDMEPTRTFGDYDVKDEAGEGVVIPTPDVTTVQMREGEFLIASTDGLWDRVSTKEVVAVARETMAVTNRDCLKTAEELVGLALEHLAYDDISIGIVSW